MKGRLTSSHDKVLLVGGWLVVGGVFFCWGRMSIFSDDGEEEEERARREGSRAGIYTTAGQPADQSLVGSCSPAKTALQPFPTRQKTGPRNAAVFRAPVCVPVFAPFGLITERCRIPVGLPPGGCKAAGLAATAPLAPTSLAIDCILLLVL